MRERAKLHGGSFKISSGKEGGTHIKVFIPNGEGP
jgi:signal transduction histidine kinase